MSRTRNRPVNSTYSLNGGPQQFIATINQEEFYEDRFPGSNQCIHGKSKLYSGPWAQSGPDTYSVTNVSLFQEARHQDYLAALRNEAYAKGYGNLNRNKLFTTNRFGLLQAIAEIDDSVAIFTTKFWKELSYGSVNWGIMPLLSELSALQKYMKNASKSFEDGQRYVDDIRIPIYKENVPTFSNSLSTVTGDLLMGYNGIIKYKMSPTLEYEKFMDRMGIHPDQNVIWDLIPLSFAVDWFAPVGEWLEDHHRSGWIRSVTFEGWLTTRFDWEATVTGRTDSFVHLGGVSSGETFHRSRIITDLTLDMPSPPRKPPERPRLPEQNAFDVWYLLGRDKTVKVVSPLGNNNKFRREFAGALRRL